MSVSIEELVTRAKPYRVSSLYKYRSFKDRGFIRIFTHNEIYLANPVQFNDPFDCRPILHTSDKVEDRKKFLDVVVSRTFPGISPEEHEMRIQEGLSRPEVFERDSLESIYVPTISPYGIYSLSEINNDILMWSHYADSHAGICIEFDSSIEKTIFWEALKVQYQDEIPVVDPMLFGEDEGILNALAVKANHWKYEEEWRVLKTKEEGGNGLHKFDPSLLKGIIIGSRIRKEDYELIEYLVKHYPTPIRESNAIVNRNKYELDIVPNTRLEQTGTTA